jgi:hypothetical protein
MGSDLTIRNLSTPTATSALNSDKKRSNRANHMPIGPVIEPNPLVPMEFQVDRTLLGVVNEVRFAVVASTWDHNRQNAR